MVISFTALLTGCAKEKRDPHLPTAAKSSSAPATTLASAADKSIPITHPEKPAKTPGKPAPAPVQEKEEFNGSQILARDAQITCKNGDCDPAVGLLSIVTKNKDGWGAGACTASLIAADTLVTNGHCIPPDMAQPGSSCKNRIWITFGDDPAHPEYDKQLRCATVLYRHEDNDYRGSDYAYLQLEKASNRPFLRQSRDGIENGKPYQLHKVNPVRVEGKRAVAGLMEKVKCLAVSDSALFPAPLESHAPTFLFADCLVIPGNSGGPILAEDGSLRGVIYSYLKKADVRGILDKNGSKLPPINGISDLNMGSNFACLNEPGDTDGSHLPAACAGLAEKYLRRSQETTNSWALDLQATARDLIAANSDGHVDIAAFGWSLQVSQSEKLGAVALGVPVCANKAGAEAIVDQTTDLHRPYFHIRADYDRHLRASNRSLIWSGFSRIAEKLLLSREEDSFKMEVTDGKTSQLILGDMLAVCP
jgi:hypothetical protein